MGVKEWLIPQDKKFFDLLDKESENMIKASKLFLELTRSQSRLKERAAEIKDVEHKNDELVHEIFDRLAETFITPIDREDISVLATTFDDVIDFTTTGANRIILYQVRPDESIEEFAKIIVKMSEELSRSLSHIKKMDRSGIEKARIEIHTLENEADDLLNESVARLFKLKDTRTIIKLKEVYEILEQVTDKCEDASDVLEDIVLKGK